MAKYNIYVTGLNATNDPCSGLGVIRCLKEITDDSIKIIGLAYGVLDGAAFIEHLVDEVYVMPSPLDNTEAFLGRLRQVVDASKVNILLPNLDFEIDVFANLTRELKEIGLHALLPKRDAVTLCKQENIIALSGITDILCPYTYPIYYPTQVYYAIRALPYPLVVKAVKGDSMVVYTVQEAGIFVERMSSQWGWPIVLQSFVSGDEFSVLILADWKHQTMGSVCMKKMVKTKNQAIWMGGTVYEEVCLGMAQKVVSAIGWIGPLEVNIIKLTDTPTYYITDVSPHFPSWVQLASKAGCNLVKSAILLALRKDVEGLSDYKTGIIFARSEMEYVCDIGKLAKLTLEKELIHHGVTTVSAS